MRIIGVHPIEASEPCHLIEVKFLQPNEIDWSEFTQELPDQDRENWQVHTMRLRWTMTRCDGRSSFITWTLLSRC